MVHAAAALSAKHNNMNGYQTHYLIIAKTYQRVGVSDGQHNNLNKSTLDNSPPPLLNLKSLLQPQGQIIDVKWEKWQLIGHFEFFFIHYWTCPRTTY